MRRILVLDDEPQILRALRVVLREAGFEAIPAETAEEALDRASVRPPDAAIVDLVLPDGDGVEVTRELRRWSEMPIIVLSAVGDEEEKVRALEAGADDYVTKPFDTAELRARMQVGARLVNLQSALADRVRELEAALSQVKQLRGLLPICCYCKKIRDDRNYWHQVESYVGTHADVRFSHGICPECSEKLRGELDKG